MRRIVVQDSLQPGYSYSIVEKSGHKFHPDFKPDLTPKEMLELGVFGGFYFENIPEEFPRIWFRNAKLSLDGKRDKELNYYKVNASQPLSVWKIKGWIHKDDPKGWFQWYCRYYIGRRHEDDMRQIKRWKAITRHVAQVVYNCQTRDLSCRPKQRQSLLHWAYDSRKI